MPVANACISLGNLGKVAADLPAHTTLLQGRLIAKCKSLSPSDTARARSRRSVAAPDCMSI